MPRWYISARYIPAYISPYSVIMVELIPFSNAYIKGSPVYSRQRCRVLWRKFFLSIPSDIECNVVKSLQAVLETSLPLKKVEAGLKMIKFWGKFITVNGKDYLLAMVRTFSHGSRYMHSLVQC